MTLKIKPNELHITRIYNAQVKQVWDAWVDPKQVAQWWGPRGFTITTVRKDVKKGGGWLYTMHGPDGVDYPNHTKFLEVDLNQRLVYDHGGFEDKPPMFRVNVLFAEIKGQTKMDMTMIFSTAEAAIEARKFIKLASGDSTWDRLAEYLEKQNSGKEVFVINRSFDVDIKTMYEVWSQPKHIMNWTPPTGFTGKYLNADIRQGGEAFYEMTGHGLSMFGKANYLKLNEPTQIIYTQIFADKDGQISRHPMAPNWPETMKTTVTFFEEGPHQTRITLDWEVFGEATEVEHNTFKSAKAGMTQGWTGSFDKLEEYLKGLNK
jgi:uncharacterized protein YndB with AHSA1/START domain